MLAAAAEAAALQGRFWEMHDSLLEDQGHLDDPHLWERARRSGSTSTASRPTAAPTRVAERVERDFRSGIRAGVTTTPTQFVGPASGWRLGVPASVHSTADGAAAFARLPRC